MPRLFVIFRTFDQIWACRTYTRELAPFDMDFHNEAIKFVFTADHIVMGPSGEGMYISNSHLLPQNVIVCDKTTLFYCTPHENFHPVIVGNPINQPHGVTSSLNSPQKRLLKRSPSLDVDISTSNKSGQSEVNKEVAYFVLPTYRCTIVVDAHAASCLSSEYSRSHNFRKRMLLYVRRHRGFRNCVKDYEAWSSEEREAWDNYLTVPYMIDFVAVWPRQKIDFSWSYRILGLLNKHLMLEEGYAWLSTLGGAHSSLGETFFHHAERAGKISGHQLRVAIELGNEQMIARCYIFWSWSLLQRGQLYQCRRCILNTWKFAQGIKARDTILENMCKAVWNRLRYKRKLLKAKRTLSSGVKLVYRNDDDFDDGGDKGSNQLHPSRSMNVRSIHSGSLNNSSNGKTSSSHCRDAARPPHVSVSAVSSVSVF